MNTPVMNTPVMKNKGILTVLLPVVLVFLLTSCGGTSVSPERTRDNRMLLGTVVSIMIQQENVPEGMFEAVFDRTEEIQNRMSINERDYDDTEVLAINRNAGVQPVQVSPDTLLVIEEGIRYGELTHGAFDISIAPLVRLWGMGTDRAAIPADGQITAVLPEIDYSAITVDRENSTVYLPREGMGIDVGGIAKGYAADEGARILREAGVNHAILDYGGDIVTIGGRPSGAPWRIGIQHPSGQRSRYIGVLDSVDESVVSSGAYERFFEEDGIRYHHIFDRATGYPSESGLVSVTVIGKDAMKTDALSTAVFVMGLEAGLELLNSLPGYDGIIATEDLEVVITAGLTDRFELRSEEYELRLK
jgi:FAD:protein FMN transferase